MTTDTLRSFIVGIQYQGPTIARLAGGGYVIAWGTVHGNSTADVCFQRFDAHDVRAGADTCIVGAQTLGGPVVTARADGGFTILWLESGDLDLSQQHWQDFDAAGNAQGAIQSGTPPMSLTAKSLAGGGFVKLLQLNSQPPTAAFQLFAADGTPIGSPQPVSDDARVAGGIVALSGGGFAVAWIVADGSAMTRAFSANGTPLGDPVALGANTLGPVNCGRFGTDATCPPFQNVSSITATDDGGYVVMWRDGTGLGTAGDAFARQFRADGSPANAVIGRIGAVSGQIAAVSANELVIATTDNSTDVTALRLASQQLQ